MAAAEPPRIASNEKVALVLGAGGARGLAQIGVIEALQARGLNIVAVAGSSSTRAVAMRSTEKLRSASRSTSQASRYQFSR